MTPETNKGNATPGIDFDALLESDETKIVPKGINFATMAEDAKNRREEQERIEAAEKARKEAEANVQLSPEQERIILAAETGQNILVTGSAGTGKSVVLRQLRQRLDSDGFGGSLAICASTGIAAINVGGSTIHSWAGLGMADCTQEELLMRVRERRRAVNRIRQARRLAIDEISMVSADLLNKIDYVFRHIRDEQYRPFGGMQIIAFGDFLQLPPVSRDGEAQFAFQSEAWARANFKVGLLKKVFRQADAAFSSALNDFRVGNVTPEAATLFATRFQAQDDDPKFEPVDIHMTNADVDQFNHDRLQQIEGDEVVYEAFDWGEEWDVKALDKSCLAPKKLALKVGAQVMLLCNLDVAGGLANGTIGKVIKLPDKNKKGWKCGPTVEFRNGRQKVLDRAKWEIAIDGAVVAERTQIPLRLAWSITGHKSQGMTLDKCRVHLANVFVEGQAYVALSRARTLEGLFIASTRQGCIKASRAAVEFYEKAVTL